MSDETKWQHFGSDGIVLPDYLSVHRRHWLRFFIYAFFISLALDCK